MLRFLSAIVLIGALCGMGGVTLVEPLTPPPIAAANGYTTLAFNQDAYTGADIDQTSTSTDAHIWHNNFWRYGALRIVPSSDLTADASGNIELKWHDSSLGGLPAPSMSSGNHTLTGSLRAYGHGYYEWVYHFTPSTNVAWSAGFLNGLQEGLDCIARGSQVSAPISPSTMYSEVDFEISFANDLSLHESYNQNPTSVNCGGAGDTGFFSNNIAPILDVTVFHKFGVLWTSTQLCYYHDDFQQPDACSTPQSGTNAQLHTMEAQLWEQCGGTANSNGGGSCTVPSEIDMYIKSIRYWSCPSWQANALAC